MSAPYGISFQQGQEGGHWEGEQEQRLYNIPNEMLVLFFFNIFPIFEIFSGNYECFYFLFL